VTSIDAALAAARRKVGVPAAEARLLLRYVLGRDAAWLAAHGDEMLSDAAAAALASKIDRRAGGEPIAYLVGEREFFGRTFQVTPDVLIPRPETELLVELSLAKLSAIPRPRLLELGTGSGCVAVTLACKLPQAQIVAADVSAGALAVAGANARSHGAVVDFRLSDWFSALDGRFDLIVANPPYVAVADPHLGEGDLRFEPSLALASGCDGLDAIRAIVAAAPRFLYDGGWLLLEHGCDQGAAVGELLKSVGMESIEEHRDLAGLDRVSVGWLRHSSRQG
jgi:release factor glutamine methyltransferase